MERKTKVLTLQCFEEFFKELTSLGHLPKILLSDKGSEFIGLKKSKLFEKWKIKIYHSPTGSPIHIVEALQAQYMRRAAIYRTALITDNPGHIMHIISEQINNQVRRVFDDKTPLQLLKMNKEQRKIINDSKQTTTRTRIGSN